MRSLFATAASMVDAAYDELIGFLLAWRAGKRVCGIGCEGSLRPRQRARGGRERDLWREVLTAPACLHGSDSAPGETGVLLIFFIPLTDTGPVTTGPSWLEARSVAQRDAYTKCREIMDNAIDLVKPGATTADICANLAKGRGLRIPQTSWQRSRCSTAMVLASLFGRSRSSQGWSRLITQRSWKREWSLRWRPYWPAKDGGRGKIRRGACRDR